MGKAIRGYKPCSLVPERARTKGGEFYEFDFLSPPMELPSTLTDTALGFRV